MKILASRKGENQKFLSDVIIKGITEILGMGLSLITFSMISRGLQVEEYSVFNQMQNITLLLAPIIALRLYTAFCAFFPGEKEKEKIRQAFFSSLLITFFIAVSIFVFMNVFPKNVSFWLFGSENYADSILIISIYVLIFSLNEVSVGYFRAVNQIKMSCIITCSKSVVQCVIFVVLYANRYSNLHTAIWGVILVELFTFMFSMLVILRNYRFSFFKAVKFSVLAPYLKYSLPLVPYTLFSWINSFLSRFIITHLDSLEASAYFIFNSSLINKMTTVTGVIGFVLFPYVAKHWNEGNKEKAKIAIERSYEIFLLIFIPAIVGVLITAPSIVLLLGGGKYYADIPVLSVLCIASLFSGIYALASFVIDLTRKTYYYTVVLLFTSAINIGLNFLLIPKYSSLGAAIATLITAFIQMVWILIFVNKIASFRFRIKLRFCLKVGIATVFMTGSLVLLYHNTTMTNFLFSVLVSGSIYLLVIWLSMRKTLLGENEDEG